MLNSIPKVLDRNGNRPQCGKVLEAISELCRIRIQSKFGPFNAPTEKELVLRCVDFER